jgi:hypothetical protein
MRMGVFAVGIAVLLALPSVNAGFCDDDAASGYRTVFLDDFDGTTLNLTR